MEFLNPYPIHQQVCYLTPEAPDFEQHYLQIRALEGRVYPDELVKQLPYVAPEHPQYKEWRLRHEATEQFLNYLSLKKPEKLLDLGCGNGWFTRLLAEQSSTSVLGLDVNKKELEQAARLFTSDNCRFAYGDIFADVWPSHFFNIIVLNSCIQYFPQVDQLMTALLSALHEDGEIHIIDSPIYKKEEVPLARQRSWQYYESKNITAMAANYYHHSWEDFKPYQPKLLYQPSTLYNRIRRKLGGMASPFPWLKIHSSI